ncbi:XrtA/PEP-CTERM system TPR-repeat protein PrsT [Photobacterium minamisatsumaniensis]|uniref:XrtA/PEP-CTERM system TPR-repeat protein PrsT n=1 Tax=Photobacterium minamisatsumaniensis TaxID=2910233 RepID=UPI003D0F34DF
MKNISSIIKALSPALLLFLAACNERSYEEYVDESKRYLSEGSDRSAIIELKNAIQLEPKQAEPRLLLGTIYLENGNFSSAEKEFNRAMRNGASKDDAEPLLARALLGQNDLQAITQLVDKSRTNSPEVMTELLAIKSLLLLQNGKQEEAEYTLELANESGVESLYSALSQASINAENKNIESALDIIDDLIDLHADNSDVWLLQGHLYTSNAQHLEAVKSYKKAVELSPDAVHYTLFLSQALVRVENYTEADKYVSYLLKVSNSHVLANELKATILYSQKEFDGAKKHAELAITNGSQNLSVYLIAGVTAYANDQIATANKYFEKVSPFVPNDHFVKRLYVSTQFKLGEVDGALKTLEEFDLSSDLNSDFLSAMSVEFAKIGRSNDALYLAKKSTSLPSSDNNLRLGLVKLANNDTSGVENLQQMLDIDPALPEANLGLAYYYLKQSDFINAERVIDEWLSAEPSDVNAILIKGLINLNKKDFDLANELFSNVLEIDPGNISASIALTQIDAIKGDKDKAYSATFKLADNTPDNFVIAKHFFKYAAESDKLDQALSLYSSKTEQQPDNVKLKLILARAQGAKNDIDSAISTLNSLTPSQQTPESWSLLALFYQSQKSYRKALIASEKWLEVDRLNPQAYMKNIQLYEITSNYNKGIKTAEKAESLFSDQPGFSLMKAGLMIKDNRLSSSQKILDSQSAEIKETPYYLRLQAMIYTANEQYDKAAIAQEKRYKLQQSLLTAKDLSRAYILNKQHDKAAAFLESVIEQYGDSAHPLTLMLAQVQLERKPNEAIRQYKEIIKREPNNVIALNNIAWLYIDKNDYSQACQSAEKAYNLAGELPEVQDTYGFCLLKSGQHKQSLEPLKMAYEQRKDNSEISLHYVESLIQNDKRNEARSILKRLSPSEPHLIELKKQLEKHSRL